MPKHVHYHFCGPDPLQQILAQQEKIMADIAELNAKVDALTENLNEQANEVHRIVELLAAIRQEIAQSPTPEQLQALGERLDGVVQQSQAVEDSLRGTT